MDRTHRDSILNAIISLGARYILASRVHMQNMSGSQDYVIITRTLTCGIFLGEVVPLNKPPQSLFTLGSHWQREVPEHGRVGQV